MKSKEVHSTVFKSFYATWELLSENTDLNGVDDYLLAWIVNGAFACELGLKYILSMENTEYNKTHLLHDLFNLLPNDIKREIWNELKSTNKFYTDEHINQGIFYISNAFEDFRYAFEHTIFIDTTFANDFFKIVFNHVNKYPSYCLKECQATDEDEKNYDKAFERAQSEMFARIKSKERKQK